MANDPEELARPSVHPWWCDCAGCWTGITVNAPKPKSLLARLAAAFRARTEETKHDD